MLGLCYISCISSLCDKRCVGFVPISWKNKISFSLSNIWSLSSCASLPLYVACSAICQGSLDRERGEGGRQSRNVPQEKKRNEDRTSTFGKVIFPKGNSREEPRVEGSGAQGRASMHYLLAAGFIRSQVTDWLDCMWLQSEIGYYK